MKFQEKYNRWLLSEAVDETTKAELKELDEREIEDRFYTDLEFGTGGLRGIMAAGTNRMNIYTVRLATQGLASEILSSGNDAAEKGVVIAYDSRNNSYEFALECVKVLSANGIKTYMFDELRPTPELSFAIRYLGCVRGIVITASHNPKEYNGYKVYGEDGSQISPETANKILSYIRRTDIFDDINIADNNAIIIGNEVDGAYIESVRNQSLNVQIPDDLKVVYTPLHGSGNKLVRKVLSDIGVKGIFVVPEQELPNGDFPTVKSPNPENPEAFSIAIEYAKKENADIIVGTDPDSDRVGVVVRDKDGKYIILNGNQTGVLLCEFILKNSKCKGRTIVKTVVTTDMVKEIAADFDVEVIDVLTGFKFIGDKIKIFEEAGNADRFIFGLEESYGYLKGTYARDKDAVVATMLITELAAECKINGITLYDRLNELYEKYGYYLENLSTETLTGLDGIKQIKSIMSKLREEKLPFEVLAVKDYSKSIDGLPKSDVLKFFVKNGWIAVRPSGTEPKIKFYFSVKADSQKEAVKYLSELKEAIFNYID